MSIADIGTPLTAAEVKPLFADLAEHPALVLAISGGPDSTALLWLAAQWRKALRKGPKLAAVTIDHGLRPEARREAAAVKQFAGSLGISHRTMRWTGRKPNTGLQAGARLARYRLLAQAAKSVGARHILTAHTLDDQAETVLFRLMRGSGIGGLGGMARSAALPSGPADMQLVRPLLSIAKVRLVATLREAGVGYADDPSNRDPRFTRARLRTVMPALAREGLTPDRLALLARRMRRAEAALDAAVAESVSNLAPGPWPERGPVSFAAGDFAKLPTEVGLRLLGRVIGAVGNEGPVELGKLESLCDRLADCGPGMRFRCTLAGAVVTRSKGRLSVERAPSRRLSTRKRLNQKQS